MKIKFWTYLWETQSMFITSFTEYTNFFPWSARFCRSLHCWVVVNPPEYFHLFSKMSFLLDPQTSHIRPDEQDMEGVTQALARIQFVYRLTWWGKREQRFDDDLFRFYPIDLANGLIAGTQTAARLSSKQVLSILLLCLIGVKRRLLYYYLTRLFFFSTWYLNI